MQNKYVNIPSKIINFSSKVQKTNESKYSVFALILIKSTVWEATSLQEE